MKSKKFGGQIYVFDSSHLTKPLANKKANQIRDSGHKARIIQRKGTGKKIYHLVYRK